MNDESLDRVGAGDLGLGRQPHGNVRQPHDISKRKSSEQSRVQGFGQWQPLLSSASLANMRLETEDGARAVFRG